MSDAAIHHTHPQSKSSVATLVWRFLRVTASFALLGAIVGGLIVHPMSFEAQLISAGLAALIGAVTQAFHAL